MSDEIGKAVMRVEANMDGFDASMRSSADAVEQFEAQAKQSASVAADALTSVGKSAETSAEQVSVGAQRFLNSLQRQAIVATQGKTGWLEYQAAMHGVADQAAPLIAQLRAVEQATAGQTAAFGAASAAAQQFAENEEQAMVRIRAMVAASREQQQALDALAHAEQRATTAAAQRGAGVRVPTAASAAAFVHEASSPTAGTGINASDMVALLHQLDPAAKKLDELDEAESKLRAGFKAGLVDIETYNGALSKIGAQRESIAAVAAGAEKAAKGMGALSHGAAGAAREVVTIGREIGTGNMARFGGSLSVLAQRLGVLDGLLTPLGLGVSAVAAVVLTAGAAWVSYENKVSAANKAIIASGDYAAQTTGSIVVMANQLGAASGHVSAAATILTTLVSSSNISSGALSNLGQAALDMSLLTGTSADKMAEYFAKAGDGAKKFAGDVIERYGLVSEATYERISELEQQGKSEQAQDVLAEALRENAQKRLEEMKGSIDEVRSFWDAAGQAASGAWNAFSRALSGATGTLAPEDELQERLKFKNGKSDAGNFGTSVLDLLTSASSANGDLSTGDARLGDGANDNRIAELQRIVAERQKVAAALAKEAQAAKDGKAAYDALSKAAQEAETPAQKLHDTQQKIIQDWNKLKETNPNSDFLKSHTLQGMLDAAAAKHAPKPKDNTQNVIGGELKTIEDQIRAREATLQGALEHEKSLRSQGLVSLQQSLQTEHDLRAAALKDQLALAQQAEQEAQGKKSLAARQQYADQVKKIQEQMRENDRRFADDSALASAKEAQAVNAYAEALQTALVAQERQNAAAVFGVAHGAQETQHQSKVAGIQFDYADKSLALSRDLSNGKISDDEYDQKRAQLQKYSEDATQIVDGSFAATQAAQSNWANGANKAYEDYLSRAQDVASQTAQAFSDAFNGMENALTGFLMTGKLNFAAFADQVIQDIVRIEIKSAEAKLLSGGSGSSSGGLGGLLSSLISVGAAFLTGSPASTSAGLGLSGSLDSSISSSASAIAAGDMNTSFGSVTPYSFHLATGGVVSGVGTETSDSVPAMLSVNEGVLNAKAMRAIGGPAVLNALNSGYTPTNIAHFASGGPVTPSAAQLPPSSSNGDGLHLTINNNGGGAQLDEKDANDLHEVVKQFVDTRLDQKMRGQGGYAYQIRNREI